MILNNEQEKVLKELKKFLSSSQTEILLLGKSGTGKTTVLAELIDYHSSSIAVATLSHRAKAVIKSKVNFSKYVRFYTLAGLLNLKMNETTGKFTEAKGDTIKAFNVIIIDECSMVSEEALSLIRKKKNKNCKIIYCGDFRQLPPVGEEKSALENSGIKQLELFQRVRQQGNTNSILAVSDIYGDAVINNTKSIVEKTDSSNIIYYKNVEQVLDLYKQDFIDNVEKPNTIRVVCYRNKVKTEVNNLIRELIFGEIPEMPYVKGDVIIMDNNYDTLENSQELSVIDSKLIVEGNYMFYKINAVKIDSDDFNQTLCVLHSNSIKQHEHDVAELFSLWDKKKDRKALSDAWSLKGKFAEVSYNFCSSVHKSQGSSYDKTVVLEYDIQGSYMSQRQKNQAMYVAITRSKNKTIIIT